MSPQNYQLLKTKMNWYHYSSMETAFTARTTILSFIYIKKNGGWKLNTSLTEYLELLMRLDNHLSMTWLNRKFYIGCSLDLILMSLLYMHFFSTPILYIMPQVEETGEGKTTNQRFCFARLMMILMMFFLLERQNCLYIEFTCACRYSNMYIC